MTPQETVNFLAARYQLDLSQKGPYFINLSRWREVGHLVNALDFKKGIEVGTYRGQFIKAMASRAPNMEFVGVDAWTSYEGYIDYPDQHLETVAEKEAKDRTAPYKNIKLIKGWSADVAPTIPNDSVDFIYIDANHSYASCVQDISLWAPKVKQGGIVMGHDYFDVRRHARLKHLDFGVIEAVNGWVSAKDVAHLFVITGGWPSWFYVSGDTL
jgi:hypothetical protein